MIEQGEDEKLLALKGSYDLKGSIVFIVDTASKQTEEEATGFVHFNLFTIPIHTVIG